MAKKSKTSGTRGSRKRRGAAESVTGAKEGAVETRTASAQGTLPIAKGADILEALNEVKGWNAKMETLKAKLKLVYKAWKAKHVSSETIKDLIALERGDANEYRQRIENLAVGLKAVGAPFQFSVFDTAYGSDVEQAKAEATIAAKAGRSPECRYPEDSEAYNAYMKRYGEIQAARVPGADTLTDEERAAAVVAGRTGAGTAQMELAH